MRDFELKSGLSFVAICLVLSSCEPVPEMSRRFSGSLAQPPEASEEGMPFTLPIRISRDFFERPMSGALQAVGLDGETLVEEVSPLKWIEKEPTEPAPTGDFIADFRDFDGCAEFSSTRGVEFCVQVMPDVSSVSLTAERTHSPGLKDWLNSRLNEIGTRTCDLPVSAVRFLRAEKRDDQFKVVYQAKLAPECGAIPMQVHMTISQF